MAAIGSRQVVQVGLPVGPVAHGGDDVALDAAAVVPAPWRGQFAGSDAVGPIRKITNRDARERALRDVDHLAAGLSGLYAPKPCLLRRLERS